MDPSEQVGFGVCGQGGGLFRRDEGDVEVSNSVLPSKNEGAGVAGVSGIWHSAVLQEEQTPVDCI